MADEKIKEQAPEKASGGEDFMEPVLPIRIGVDEWCFHNSMMINRMSLEDVIETVGGMDVEGIGFDYFMMSREARKDPAALKELLQENELDVVLGFGIPFALPEIFHQIMESRKEEMFDLAHDFGCKTLRVCGGFVLPNMFHKPFHIVLNKEKEINDVARKLKIFTEDAALEGFTVSLENHTDYTLSEMLEILDRVDHDKLKVTLDTGNALFHREDPVETAEKLAFFVDYTHIKDMAHTGPLLLSVPLGEGEVDIPSIIEILRNHNYDGLYSIEVNLPLWKVDREEDSLRDSIEYLKQFND